MEYKITKTLKSLFGVWGCRLKVEDTRNGTKQIVRGHLIGLTDDELLIKVKEDVKTWFPMKDDKINYFLLK